MSDLNLNELPFYGLTDSEFMRATRTWVFHSSSLLTDSRDLFRSVIESPDKNDINMNMIESKYYNVKQTGVLIQKTSTKGFSIFSCNICSLLKNLCLLNDILLTVKESPSLISISEKRLSDSNVNNISIPGYEFISKASKTNEGSVGMYIKDTLKFIKRPDLEITLDGVETCFIELPRVKLNNVIVACIYRHPRSDRKDFNVNLREKLLYLTDKQAMKSTSQATSIRIFFNTVQTS